jgi:hypothetical protein
MRNKSLVETLFALEEPWQSQFLIMMANLATNWTWNGETPTREEIVTWSKDQNVRREVALLLYAWQKSETNQYLLTEET